MISSPLDIVRQRANGEDIDGRQCDTPAGVRVLFGAYGTLRVNRSRCPRKSSEKC